MRASRLRLPRLDSGHGACMSAGQQKAQRRVLSSCFRAYSFPSSFLLPALLMGECRRACHEGEAIEAV